ncbi:unnamed protein product [Hermetia illucens]|uniref:Uncharacterized protein n=1 Tax=Hermetia illucens TaxID=343691 RepID=A0A7R8YPI7_HERIL|nr:unnamed protein product [Hermetia illucens]
MLLRKLFTLASVGCCLLAVVGGLNAERVRRTTTSNILSRKRRYVAFPEGSSFTVAICLEGGIVGNPNLNILVYTVNWGVAYDLPNETWTLANIYGFKGENDAGNDAMEDDMTSDMASDMASNMTTDMASNMTSNMASDMASGVASDMATEAKTKRMFRRDLYKKIEILINSLGYNGKECIMKTLCETRKAFAPRNANMVERMLRTIFSFPKVRPFAREHREIHEYDMAYRSGKASNCSLLYPKCDFSILDFALGKYSFPYK